MSQSGNRRDAAIPNNPTQNVAEARRLSHAASPIIKVNDANAVNQVMAASASHPLIPSTRVSWAAPKYQR